MKSSKLVIYNFMALSCTLGMFSKKLINPIANLITDSLHIPGGIGAGFSIMFLVITVEIIRSKNADKENVEVKNCGMLMGTVQGLLALALGRVGSMGILSPIGYILPGIAIDFAYKLQKDLGLSMTERMVFANSLASVTASLTANAIVFHLFGPVLGLYTCVAAMSGTLFGILGARIVNRVRPILSFE